MKSAFRLRMSRAGWVIAILCVPAAHARQSPPARLAASQAASRRFPQPVRVSDLLHRAVLQPVEAQTVLGHVDAVVRDTSGAIEAVIDYGGVLGIGSRKIAVPVDAMVLLGQDMEILDFNPAQLRQFPTYDGKAAPVGGEEKIEVGLAAPSH